MRLLTRCFAATIFVLFFALIANSQVPEGSQNEVEVRGVVSVPSGEASFSSNGSLGSVISFERDLTFATRLASSFVIHIEPQVESTSFREVIRKLPGIEARVSAAVLLSAAKPSPPIWTRLQSCASAIFARCTLIAGAMRNSELGRWSTWALSALDWKSMPLRTAAPGPLKVRSQSLRPPSDTISITIPRRG